MYIFGFCLAIGTRPKYMWPRPSFIFSIFLAAKTTSYSVSTSTSYLVPDCCSIETEPAAFCLHKTAMHILFSKELNIFFLRNRGLWTDSFDHQIPLDKEDLDDANHSRIVPLDMLDLSQFHHESRRCYIVQLNGTAKSEYRYMYTCREGTT